MKTLYSSSFLSIILAFFTLLGMQDKPAEIIKSEPLPTFSNIIRPATQPISEFETVQITDKVNIEVFFSLNCEGCNIFGLYTVPALYEKYSENENVNLQIYLNPNKENESEYYAVTAIKCAEEHDKYWEMYNEVFTSDEPLTRREADLIGQGMGLPIYEFRNCLKSGKYDEFIDAVNDVAKTKGVKRMPITYINDYILMGNQPIENIDKIVNEITKN
ncbi:thioredoxin domain-containing protein [Candidatus Peregrinibacteria bacterium]|nr:thioredoxin domain-containing protein [Candidatus Peregrinibacteria bacterium]